MMRVSTAREVAAIQNMRTREGATESFVYWSFWEKKDWVPKEDRD